MPCLRDGPGRRVPMARQRSLGEYRAIDLCCFLLMLALFETVLRFAATRLFPAEPYTVSVTAAVTAIVMMRWGPWAAVHAAFGGILACLLAGARWDQYLIYGLGNLLSLLALLLLKKWGREETRKDDLQSRGFGLVTALSCAGMIFLRNGIALAIMVGLLQMGYGGRVTAYTAFIPKHFGPGNASGIYGVAQTGNIHIDLIAPLATAWIRQSTGVSFTPSFVLAIVFIAAACWFFAVIPKARRDS